MPSSSRIDVVIPYEKARSRRDFSVNSDTNSSSWRIAAPIVSAAEDMLWNRLFFVFKFS